MLHPAMDITDPQLQQQRMQEMMRRQEQAARRMVVKIENLIEGSGGSCVVDLHIGAREAEEDDDEGMIWKMWRGAKYVGWTVGRTIFWCNRGDEEE